MRSHAVWHQKDIPAERFDCWKKKMAKCLSQHFAEIPTELRMKIRGVVYQESFFQKMQFAK